MSLKNLSAVALAAVVAVNVAACRASTVAPAASPPAASRSASELAAPATGRPVLPIPSASASSAVPVTGHSPVMTSQAAVAPARSTAGCYPLTDGGKCYSPGEFCRDDDHGTAGIDGDGNPVTCTDNDGWRWEAG